MIRPLLTSALTLCLAIGTLAGPALKAGNADKAGEQQGNKNGGLMKKLQKGAKKATRTVRKTAGRIENWSRKKLNQYLSRLAEYRPVLREAGFEINQMRVRVGLVPRATVICTQMKKLSKEKREELLEKHSDKEVLSLFLKLLFKAYEVDVSGYKTKAIWVTLSVSPHSTAVLEPKEEKEGEASE